jgi:hypothetical protein
MNDNVFSFVNPSQLKFRPILPILNVEAQAHPESNGSQPIEEPLNIIMKKKNEIMKMCDTFKINGPCIFLRQNL